MGAGVVKGWWARGADGLWFILVVLLPVTSLPLLVRLVGSDTVAAPSGLALLLLTSGWLLPRLFAGGTLPRQVVPLFAVASVALISSLLSLFIELPAYKGIAVFQNTLSALVTLAVGVCFYLLAATFAGDDEHLRWTLKLLNGCGLVVIIWSVAQMIGWHTARYPDWMREIHGYYSIGPLYRERVTGFALEPSWLANQVNLLFLPYWLAASVRRFSVHKFRIAGITFENLLALGGVVVLMLTFSRVGLLAFLFMLGYLLLRLNLSGVRWLHAAVLSRWQNPLLRPAVKKFVVYGVMLILVGATYIGMLLAAAYGLSRLDPRMRDMFTFHFGDPDAFMKYAAQLTFAARVVYWEAGWGVFNQYPWLGVGLGNAGYFFSQTLSDYSWRLMEVRELVFRSANLLNNKSLWVRLLAETGVIGFAFFVSWLYVLWKTGQYLMAGADQLSPVMGLMAQLVIVGLLIEGFSLDTFALPYFWLPLGLATAAAAYGGGGRSKGKNIGDGV